MTSESQEFPTIPPPTTENLVVKDKLELVLELLWLILAVIPWRVVLGLHRKMFPPPEKSLKGQVIIVTGAGHGLGQGLALKLAGEGAKVAVVDINQCSAIKTVQAIEKAGGIAKPYFTNVGSVEEIHQLNVSVTEELGPVDVLVNNAGIIHVETLANISEEELRSVIEINLLSHFWMAQEFLPEMKNRNSGHIVTICSMSAISGLQNATAYSASKWGLMGFMDALRKELNTNPTNNIKTTTVLPYFINTSEYYVNNWNLRLPPLSIEQVVEDTITAVKKEQEIISIPSEMYYSGIIARLLPTYIQDKFCAILYLRLTPLTKENKKNDPSQRLICELAKRQKLHL